MEKKRKIILISLISAFFSLIYILLSHFGILRYFSFYLYNIEKFAKNYSKLDSIGNKRIVINIIWDSKNTKKLDKTIKSLLDQTVKVNLITITLPPDSNYKKPKKLDKYLILYKTKINYGKTLNSIIPSLIREPESTTKHIILQGNYIYGKDFIESILNISEKYPNKIIFNKTDKFNQVFLINSEFFSEEFFNKPKNISDIDWFNKFVKKEDKKFIKYRQNYKII